MKYLSILMLAATMWAQIPVAEAPRVMLDTTYTLPTSGTTYSAHTAADFTTALAAANSGDVILLDAGVTYTGNFVAPVKAANGKWVYIISSGLSKLPSPGTRVSPSDAVNMARLASANTTPVILFSNGANHYRLVGLEVTTTSKLGGTVGQSPYTSRLVDMEELPNGPVTDFITVDRCYIHGSPSIDARVGVTANASNAAVIDSYISDIHQSTNDSQAVLSYYSNGPLKVVNNYLEATGENLMLGGGGTYKENSFVPADVEIRNNWFFKPLSWIKSGVGGTIPPNNQWASKNLIEFKCAHRVLVDGNTFENTWPSAQTGWTFNIKPLTGNGSGCVEDDITITNNVLKNVSSGITMMSFDPDCKLPDCGPNYGELKRVVIKNNLIMLGDTTQQGYGNGYVFGLMLVSDMTKPQPTDILIQHNTVVPPPDLGYCKGSFYWELTSALPDPPASRTHNVWVLDNSFCRQSNGPGTGYIGQLPYTLTDFMGDPAPPEPRLFGNVFYVPKGDTAWTLPAHNWATATAFTFDALGNMLTPKATDTTDGKQAGYHSLNSKPLPPTNVKATVK